MLSSLYVLWPVSVMIEEGFSIDLGPIFSGQGIRFVSGVPYYSGGIAPSIANFVDALYFDRFPRLVINSTSIALLSTALAMATGTPAGYLLARLKVRGKGVVSSLLLALRTVSPFAIILPLYLLYTRAGLWDTHFGMAVVYLTINVPVVVWMLRGLFVEIPREIYEAGEVAGASEHQIFWRIALPSVLLGVTATAMFAFVLVWNEFLLANLLTGPNAKTVSVGIWSGVGEKFGAQASVDWDEINTLGTLAFFPALALVLTIRRHVVRGLSLATAR